MNDIKSTRVFIVAVAATLFAMGCTTSPASLKSSSKTDCVVLQEDSFWSESRGMMGLIFEEGLRKGVYRASFEDEHGVYYEGNKTSVWNYSYLGEKPKDPIAYNNRFYSDGGIWLPRDTSKPPRVYSYVGTNRRRDDSTEVTEYNEPSVPVYTPSNIGPVERGAATGVATGIVELISSAQKGRILFYEDVGDDQFSKKLRATSTCPNLKQ